MMEYEPYYYGFVLAGCGCIVIIIISASILIQSLLLKIGKWKNFGLLLITAFTVGWTQQVCRWGDNHQFHLKELVQTGFVLGFMLFFQVMVAKKLLYKKRNLLTSDSVKESLDAMPEGICFSKPDGTPMLVNRRMHQVADEIFGTIVLNTKECDRKLHTGEVKQGVSVISTKPDYIVKTQKHVWNIKYTLHHNLKEIVAINITEEYRLTEKIHERNRRLSDINARLKDNQNHLECYICEKELLATKIHIHDDIGRSLLEFRMYLSREEKQREELVELWKRNIRVMMGETDLNETEDDWEQLLKAADHVKVAIELEGILPKEGLQRKMALNIILECLNNTVRHARGNQLNVRLKECEGILYMTVRNNGNCPKAAIEEKGGLSNIRKGVELLGGRMRIESFPFFILTVELPIGVY